MALTYVALVIVPYFITPEGNQHPLPATHRARGLQDDLFQLVEIPHGDVHFRLSEAVSVRERRERGARL